MTRGSRLAKIVGWMALGQLALILVLWINTTLWLGSYVDSICVEGKLSAEQASLINGLEWGKCPKYRQRQNKRGSIDSCQVEVRDRVITRECSEAMKSLWARR